MENSYLQSIEEARRLVREHLGDWKAIDTKVLDIVENAQKIGTVPISSGSLKEMNNRIEEQVLLRQQLNKVVEEQATKIKALQSQLSKLSSTEKGRSRSLTDEERQLRTLAKSEERLIDVKSKHWRAIESNRQEANRLAQATRNTLTTYGAYSQKLISLSRTYKDLAIRKATLNNLSDEEIASMDRLGAEITDLRGKLVQVDHSVGQFGRSVGSYGKKFDSLGFSIAQITREMPAFAYGAQIGFAALSNNIPMLFDEITKVKLEMKDLAAQGKATGSVIGRLGSAIFSFQSLISVGVTLLTLYGADLIEMAFGATSAEKAQAELNKAIAEGEADSRQASQEMRAYVSILQDAEASEEARAGALKALKEDVTELKDVELEQADAMKTIVDRTGPYIVAAEARAKADAFARLTAEAEAKMIQSKQAAIEDSVKWYDYVTSAVTNFANLGGTAYGALSIGVERHSETVKDNEAAYETLQNTYLDYLEKALAAESKIKDLSDATDGNTDAVREQVTALENLGRIYTVDYYESFISAMEAGRKKVAQSSEEWASYTDAINKAKDAIAIITDVKKWAQEEMTLDPDDLEDFNLEVTATLKTKGIEDGMEVIKNTTGETLESLYREFTTYYGTDWDSFVKFFNAKMEKEEEGAERIKELRKEIADAAIEFGSAMFEAEIERIDQKIERNKDYFAKLLATENLTEERRAALEAERDLKERQLLKEKKKRENQQFLFEQGIALAKVAMHTAVAVAEALPNLGLAALVGILGGIQAATIIAQSIPKFQKGTENAPAGWAIVDEVTPEVHTDRRGRVKSYGSESGPNLRFLEHGDKIYRSREEYFKKVGMENIEKNVWELNMRYQGRPVPVQSSNMDIVRELMALRGDSSKVWREVKRLASRPIHNNVKVEIPDKRPY